MVLIRLEEDHDGDVTELDWKMEWVWTKPIGGPEAAAVADWDYFDAVCCLFYLVVVAAIA